MRFNKPSRSVITVWDQITQTLLRTPYSCFLGSYLPVDIFHMNFFLPDDKGACFND
jgi:hypothetical protein